MAVADMKKQILCKMPVIKVLLAFFILWSSAESTSLRLLPAEELPDPDGDLHLWSLPVGQGDMMAIQCPDGNLTIMDGGTMSRIHADLFTWEQVERWLNLENNPQNVVGNILITHNHYDHYHYLTRLFQSKPSTLQNIYASCNKSAMPDNVNNWLELIDHEPTLFNYGHPCEKDCASIAICGESYDIKLEVLAANLGGCTGTETANEDSIVSKLIWGNVSVFLAGDLKGESLDNVIENNEVEMKSTIYKMNHHGAPNENPKFFTDHVAPQAVFTSGNPYYTYGHPSCNIIDNLLPLLCNFSSEANCSGLFHYVSQDYLTCMTRSGSGNYITIETRKAAMFSFVGEDETDVNLIHVVLKKDQWGIETFKTNIPRKNSDNGNDCAEECPDDEDFPDGL